MKSDKLDKYNVKTLINGRTRKSKKNTTIKQIDKLVKTAECYIFNTGIICVKETLAKIKSIIG